MEDLSFDTSTFNIQVHGLLLNMLHLKSALLIMNIVGMSYENSINRRTMVANRLLSFRVDVRMMNLL